MRDHPRVCGEKASYVPAGGYRQGSPPRVRGKVGSKLSVDHGLRITPACAGKSRMFSPRSAASWDHPRVCGEKYHYRTCAPYVTGSPPRVRGKVDRGIAPIGPLGITPACAGKRQPVLAPPAAQRDHPRVCGEKTMCCCLSRKRPGSPPRVRGKACRAARGRWSRGITPACAGKSVAAGVRRVLMAGSPPRVRGKEPDLCCPCSLAGITPACAGKSATSAAGRFCT